MRTSLFLLALSSFILSGCSFIQQRVALKNCSFSLEGGKLKSADLKGFSMDIFVSVHNPNSVDAVLDRFVGSVFLEGSKVADVSNEYKEVVKAASSKSIPISVSVRYSDIVGSAMKIMKAVEVRRANVRIDGRAYMDYTLPFLEKRTFSYPVKLSKTIRF